MVTPLRYPTSVPDATPPTRWKCIQDTPIERHEAKYIVPIHYLPEIRRFIQPFVKADKNGIGDFPRYLVRTIQLDGPDLGLHRAKEVESLNRFKLRIRTYGTECKAPVFFEIKRKLGDVIVKSRATVSADDYSPEMVTRPSAHVAFHSEKENMNYLNFLRLTKEIGARPQVMVQYERESYMGLVEDYARITFDTNICYQPVADYRFDRVNERRWRHIDTQMGLRTPFPGFILEVKSKTTLPFWMAQLIRSFNLVCVGFCKYSAAMRMELVNHGHTFSDTSENCTPDSRW